MGAFLLATGCAGATQEASVTTPGASTSSAPPSPSKTAIQYALSACGIPEAMAHVGDEGHTATLHWGLVSDKLSANDVGCILGNTRMPSSVESQINATRALDGMQHASWGQFKATWTFHPDNGSNLILTDNQ